MINLPALTIEGLGRTSTSMITTRPLRLSVWSGVLSSPTRYYWPALADFPDQVESELDVLEGMVTQSSLSFTLGNLDADDDEARDIRRFFLLARPERQASLDADYTVSAATISVTLVPGAQTPSVGDVWYAGREAMRLNNVSGTAPNLALTVTRGVFGTTAQALAAGRDSLYDVSPTPLDRLVTLYAVDAEDSTSEVVAWRGVLEDVHMDGRLLRVELTCRDFLSFIGQQKLGQGRLTQVASMPRYNLSGGKEVWYTGIPIAELPEAPYRAPLYDMVHMAVGKSVFRVASNTFNSRVVAGQTFWRHGVGPGDADGRLSSGAQIVGEDAEGIDYTGGSRYLSAEVQVSGAAAGFSPFRNEQGTSDENGLSDWFGDIARNILCSTGETSWDGSLTPSHRLGSNGDFDSLPGNWGLGIPDAFVDHATFEEVKNLWPWSQLQAANFILGTPADSDELPVASEVIKTLIRSAACYIYTGPSGLISLGRLSDPGPLGVDAEIGPQELDPEGLEGVEVRPADIGPVHRIEAQLMRYALSDEHAVKIIGAELSGETEARYLRIIEPEDIDAGHYGDPDGSVVNSTLRNSFIAAMKKRYALISDYLPQYVILLRPDAPSIQAGQWISLTHPAIPHPDTGARGIEDMRCLVIRAQREIRTLHIDGVGGTLAGQELTVVNYYPVNRANSVVLPSWRISSVTSNTKFDLDGEFGGDGSVGSSDADLWRKASVGDYWVDLWTADGKKRSVDGPQKGDISSGAVTLLSPWTEGGAPVTPTSNDIIRVAAYDAAGDWVTDHDYVWIANGDAALIPSGGGTAAAARWDV